MGRGEDNILVDGDEESGSADETSGCGESDAWLDGETVDRGGGCGFRGRTEVDAVTAVP